MKQYGSATNTKLDYQKMARKYAVDFLNLKRDYDLILAALKEQEEANDGYKKEIKQLRAENENQANRIADKSKQHTYMGCTEYCGTK